VARVADVKLTWVRSPSADITTRNVEITVNGQTTTVSLGPEVSDYTIEVSARSTVQFRTTVYDSEGNEASSETYTFTIGDLEAPVPDTGLFHEVVGTRDVADPVDVPVDPVAE